MKAGRVAMGVTLILAGGVFALQGLNVLPGSFMTGRPEWAILGTLGVVGGVALVAAALRGRGK